MTGLTEQTTYHFAIKTTDNADNVSDLSNVPSDRTPDTVPPVTIADLDITGTTETSAMLTWTAPTDVDKGKSLGEYDIRYATTAITEGTWDAATQVADEPTPGTPGSQETHTVTGLSAATIYHIAIKTVDNIGNVSALSNVPSDATQSPPPDTTSPAAIADLTATAISEAAVDLEWTAPGDDGGTGTASEYAIRYHTSQITSGNWDSATAVASPPTPSPAGSQETFSVTSLTMETMYYFAIRTADEVPNWSDVSNSPDATTLDAPLKQLTNDAWANRNPRWAPDGDYIAFHSTRDRGRADNKDVYVLQLSDLSVTRMTTDASQDQIAAWSNDGSEIVYHSQRSGNRDIWVTDWPGNTYHTQITTDTGWDSNPHWSPVDDLIAFSSGRQGNLDIWTIDRNSPATVLKITDNSGSDKYPAMSPDGTQIAYTHEAGGNEDIWIIDVATQQAEALVTGPESETYPSWSSDGTRIAFSSTRSVDREIWIVDVATGALEQITSSADRDDYPDWSPDGTMLVFTSLRGGNIDLWRIRLQP